jgi:hypothetical protein
VPRRLSSLASLIASRAKVRRRRPPDSDERTVPLDEEHISLLKNCKSMS